MTGALLRSRWPAYGVGLALVVASALPAFRHAGSDGYPFSTYPMFTAKRDRPHMAFIERLEEKSRTSRLSPDLLGSRDFMQAYATLQRTVERGPEAARELCRTVAERIERREKGRKPVRLRVVRARFDPVAYFAEAAEPDRREVIATCRAGQKR
jgi:hypothetical protein